MPEPGLSIRRATHADMDRIFDLWHQLAYSHVAYHPDYYLMAEPEVAERAIRDYLGGLIDDDEVAFAVAELAGEANVDGEIVGYCTAAIKLKPPVFQPVKELMVQTVVVDENHRRRGVFAAMHAHLVAWGRARGATQAELTVDARNPAVAAYRSVGYEVYQFKMVADIAGEEE